MKDDHIIQVINEIEEKITFNQLICNLILNNEVSGYKLTNTQLLTYRVVEDPVSFVVLKLNTKEFFVNNEIDLLEQMVKDLEYLFSYLAKKMCSQNKMQELLYRIKKIE